MVVIKVAKPNQDWRFDIPVIGITTLNTMTEVHARILAIEAGSTLIFDKHEVVELAKKNNITIIAL